MAVGDLTTLANVKAFLGLSQAADDVLLARLITAASGWLESYLSRTILSASYTEVRDGTGGSTMVLRNRPVTAVASVSISGLALPVSSGPGVAGFRFDENRLIIEGYRFTIGRSNVAISYTAGFATVPPEVEQAVVDLVALKYRSRDRIGHQSKTLSGETVTFMIRDMPDDVRTLLNQIANVVPV